MDHYKHDIEPISKLVNEHIKNLFSTAEARDMCMPCLVHRLVVSIIANTIHSSGSVAVTKELLAVALEEATALLAEGRYHYFDETEAKNKMN